MQNFPLRKHPHTEKSPLRYDCPAQEGVSGLLRLAENVLGARAIRFLKKVWLNLRSDVEHLTKDQILGMCPRIANGSRVVHEPSALCPIFLVL